MKTPWGQYTLEKRPKLSDIQSKWDFIDVITARYLSETLPPPPQPTPYEETLYRRFMTDEGRRALMNLIIYAPEFAQRFLTALATVYPMALPPLRRKMEEEYRLLTAQTKWQAYQIADKLWQNLIMVAETEEEEHKQIFNDFLARIQTASTPYDLLSLVPQIRNSPLNEYDKNVLISATKDGLTKFLQQLPAGSQIEQEILQRMGELGIWTPDDSRWLGMIRQSIQDRFRVLTTSLRSRIESAKRMIANLASNPEYAELAQRYAGQLKIIENELENAINIYNTLSDKEKSDFLKSFNNISNMLDGWEGDMENALNVIVRNLEKNFGDLLPRFNDFLKLSSVRSKEALDLLKTFLNTLSNYGSRVAQSISQYLQDVGAQALTPDVIRGIYDKMDDFLRGEEDTIKTVFGSLPGHVSAIHTIESLRQRLGAAKNALLETQQKYQEVLGELGRTFDDVLKNTRGIIGKLQLSQQKEKANIDRIYASIQQGWARIKQQWTRIGLQVPVLAARLLTSKASLILSTLRLMQKKEDQKQALTQLLRMAQSLANMLANPFLHNEQYEELYKALDQLISKIERGIETWDSSSRNDSYYQELANTIKQLATIVNSFQDLPQDLLRDVPLYIPSLPPTSGQQRQSYPQTTQRGALRPPVKGTGGKKTPVGSLREQAPTRQQATIKAWGWQ